MIIDRLTKMRYYIAYKADNKGTSAEQTAWMYIEHIWKHHGLLKSIMSDRDSQFILMFWMIVYKMLKIEMKLSTVFHSQMNRQSKAVNREMK